MSSAPVMWEFKQAEPPEASSWEKTASPPEEDTRLEEVLDAAEVLVCDELNDEEPMILRSAFNRAEEFLRVQSSEMKKRLKYYPPVPNITPGPRGSADLHWQKSDWRLLVNVPATNAPPTFYGDSLGGGRIKGNLESLSWNLGICTWLSK